MRVLPPKERKKEGGIVNLWKSFFTVRMDGEEREISKEQLQSWIRDEVHKARLTSPGILRNYTQLQSLLQRRQIQGTRFVELCQSVMVFEDTVKEMYSQLGWEYTDFDSDSDNGDEPMSCRRTLPFLFVSSGDRIRRPSTSRVPTTHSLTSEDEIIGQKRPAAFLDKEAMVVLSKLTPSQIAAMAPPAPDGNSTKDAISSSPESDMQWEPDEEMSVSPEGSDSDFSTGSNKKRKMNRNERKYAKLTPSSKRRRKTAAKTRKEKAALSNGGKSTNDACVVAETSSSPATSSADAECSKQDAAAPLSNSTKTSKGEQERGTKNTSLTNAEKTGVKTTFQAKMTETTAQSSKANATSKPTLKQSTTPPSKTVSAESNTKQTAASQPSTITTATPPPPPPPPSIPKEEIKLNMIVLARKKPLCWQRGKVAEIITKENGKVKYKITFEEKGKVLVSGHHLAFDRMPKVEELSVGCRVVVKSPSDATYQPAIMAELPGRKNRMRFLVYTDDHTPMYVGLPSFHVVYRPLENPLDDIPDENHREFMKEYLRVWPYPPQTQYKVGQSLKAEYEGVMQKCEVVAVDSSLIEVIFESDQHKEWLYRGSLRLEHMVNMKYCIWKNQDDKSKKPC